jgi:hypothetical protein
MSSPCAPRVEEAAKSLHRENVNVPLKSVDNEIDDRFLFLQFKFTRETCPWPVGDLWLDSFSVGACFSNCAQPAPSQGSCIVILVISPLLAIGYRIRTALTASFRLTCQST